MPRYYTRGGKILPAMRQSFTHSIETYFSPPTDGRSCRSLTTTYWKSFRSGLEEYLSSGTASTRAAPIDTIMRGIKRPPSLVFLSPTPDVPYGYTLSTQPSNDAKNQGTFLPFAGRGKYSGPNTSTDFLEKSFVATLFDMMPVR